MRAWRTHQYGPPREALHLDEVDAPEPGPGELLVQVAAIPLNLNDIERISGGNMMVEPELPYSPGMEVMGTVVGCGPGAEGWLGKRVAGTTRQATGGYAELAICPAVGTFEMPESIPLPDAAALLFPFHLAWLGLYDRAALQPGESVLVTAAAGGSGSAAIQLAKHRGARVFATAGSAAKVALCRELGADVAIDYSCEDVAATVLAETGGAGVDVVFDNVGEAMFETALRCTAYGGRYLMMGFASNKAVADEAWIVPRRIITANVMLCGVLLAYATDDVRQLVKSAMGWNFLPRSLGETAHAEVLDLVARGAVRAVVGQVVSFEDIPDAITAMGNRETTGRVIALVRAEGDR